MELALLVYAVSLLDGLLKFLTIMCAAAMLGAAASGMALLESYNDTTVPKRWFRRSLVSLAIMGFIGTLIPSERTAYIMVAAYATQQVAQAPEVRETGEKVLTLINSKLDQIILEAQSPKKGK